MCISVVYNIYYGKRFYIKGNHNCICRCNTYIYIWSQVIRLLLNISDHIKIYLQHHWNHLVRPFSSSFYFSFFSFLFCASLIFHNTVRNVLNKLIIYITHILQGFFHLSILSITLIRLLLHVILLITFHD